jgi:hypothetical protein
MGLTAVTLYSAALRQQLVEAVAQEQETVRQVILEGLAAVAALMLLLE